MGAVAAGHATDLWGVALVTVGVLCGVAFYGDSLGPAGKGARVAVGDLLGWGRFLVPLVLVAVGVRMLMGRGDDAEDDGRTRREPARAVIGGTLVLLAVAGLAALAGGSPALRASTHDLSAAGGWVGAVIADPLGHALGGFGAAVVLVVVAGVGVLVFTGVSVRTAASGIARAVRWPSPRPGATGRPTPSADGDEPTDPFGRALAEGRQPSMAAVAAPRPTAPRRRRTIRRPTPTGRRRRRSTRPTSRTSPRPLPDAATRPGKGEQLEMRMGPAGGRLATPAGQAAQAGEGPGHRRVRGRRGRRGPGQRAARPTAWRPGWSAAPSARRSPATSWSWAPG